MELRFTRHAQEKFQVLKRHAVLISQEQVEQTVIRPTLIDRSRLPLLIAQGSLDPGHVLRVVYRVERQTKVIITFYPGRKKQYEI
ncbi:MAG: hypothetical protein UY76_C0015G0009 [Candidatus Uhrbacteria bacterium GW2011_GWA2_52_8d]|uniref:DUF4258 domain-containing protein n=1 Tax=Candidatus Uhrbacteria bacterium GW2011_GWA2_52_8d TaxID=1618979 RepID=A0A0G1XNM7_9BACT|nr:MAG: hypothetical protein UY76_C0015G0009 [Candidatus Uhrbacteria bacterium GW2011_GWA2_52_8d]